MNQILNEDPQIEQPLTPVTGNGVPIRIPEIKRRGSQ